jgi:hypothetical protein
METRESRATSTDFLYRTQAQDLLHIGLPAEEANFGLYDVHTLDDAGT